MGKLSAGNCKGIAGHSRVLSAKDTFVAKHKATDEELFARQSPFGGY
jgi:hypothetical protein